MLEKKTKKILVHWSGLGVDERKCAKRWAGERVYASREAVRLPAGMLVPAPDSWELYDDRQAEYRGGRLYLPRHELEPTARGRGRIRFYYSTLYGPDGRDAHGPSGNTFVLPHGLGPEIFVGEVFGYTINRWPWLNPD